MVSFPYSYLFKAITPELTAAKRAKHKCVSWGCRRKAGIERTRCETCRSRLYRLRYDDRYAYNNLKSSARKRHIGFDLSFDDFVEFCSVTGYLEARGQAPESLTIDRIKTNQPYRIGNLRVLTHADNSSHQLEEL